MPLLLSLLLTACTGEPEDTAPTELPEPEDTGSLPVDTDGVPFPVDTGLDTGFDQVPTDTITFEQRGLWTVNPEDSTLTGSFLAFEYLNEARPEFPDTGDTGWDSGDTGSDDTGSGGDDTGGDTGEPGDDEPEPCLVRYEITGIPLDPHSCTDCAVAWEVTFTVIEGNTAVCLDPDLPQDGEIAHFGHDPSNELIRHDYAGTGMWLAWWDAMQADELLAIQWVATTGIVLPEEDE